MGVDGNQGRWEIGGGKCALYCKPKLSKRKKNGRERESDKKIQK